MADFSGLSIGRYRIIEPLGEGGMATVYKAYDTSLENEVAIKFIRHEQIPPAQWQHMLKRFEREAKRMAKFTHPNIVKVMDYGDYEGNPYLVMPYLTGGTLKDKLKANIGVPMEYREACRLLAPIARALEYAHEEDTIHRDVKPANILLTLKGQPMVTDFGVAKILDLDEGQTLTGTGVGVGTPEYMAPEQWLNKVIPQTDVYALGVVLYLMVTGKVPFDAETPLGVHNKQLTEPLPRPKELNSELSDEVERVLYKALAKDPMARYANMGEFAQALENILQPQQVRIGERVEEKLSGKRKEREEPQQEQKREGETERVPEGKSCWVNGLVIITTVLLVVLLGLVMYMIQGWGNKAAGVLVQAETKEEETVTMKREVMVSAEMEVTQTAIEDKARTEASREMETEVAMSIAATRTAAVQPTKEFDIGSEMVNEKDGAEMVYVPAGEFLMGSTQEQADAAGKECGSDCYKKWFDAETPQHTVYLDEYWLYKTEVTNVQYAKCVGTGSCSEPSDTVYYNDSSYAQHPVVYVNWEQAKGYCAWAGGRMPSEAEWEKAARGTDGRTYPWGNQEPTCDLANFESCGGKTKEVGNLEVQPKSSRKFKECGKILEAIN